ncbi:MAG: alpha/beta fold hydrolase [SAR324 cluster bacterium]|nr:alpha/beta fold hydrolase [SAR324 cluster bacterium]
MEMNMDNMMMSAANLNRAAFKLAEEMISSTYLNQLNPWLETTQKYFHAKSESPESAQWYSANQVILQKHKTALRQFVKDKKGTPLILVPPEAGHDSSIVDYGPEQSLVECALKNYSGNIYVLDKLPATFQDTGYSIDDAILSVDAAVDKIGEPVNIIGFCQGGWQSAIYTALFPEKVKSLTVAAGPIDFHAGDAKITNMAKSLPIGFYEQMVALGGGNMPGAFIILGFMLMNPVDRFLGDDLNLFNHVDDAEYVQRHQHFQNWYQKYQTVPGQMYLQIVQQLFKENRLIENKLKVLGRMVDLKAINQPLFLIGGLNDDITPPPQVMAMQDYVSSKTVEQILVPAGHIGVFMGSDIIKNHWPGILKNL